MIITNDTKNHKQFSLICMYIDMYYMIYSMHIDIYNAYLEPQIILLKDMYICPMYMHIKKNYLWFYICIYIYNTYIDIKKHISIYTYIDPCL